MSSLNASKPRLRRTHLLAIPLLLASTASFADVSPALDRFSLSLGGYYANTDTTIGAGDPSGRFKGDVNLERDLGFEDHKTVPRIKLDFLLGDHQGFSFDYFSVNRTRTKSISDGISYGGNDYEASASVSGKLDFDFGSAAYRWWFGSGSDAFGLGIGAAYYRVHAGISGIATLNDESAQASTSYSETAGAPLLQIGWRHAFNDSVRMYFDASGVKKNGGNLNGHIYNAALGLEWYPWKNVGVGAEYAYTRIKLNDERDTFNADLDLKLHGPSAFVKFRF
jgi:opacity protein-like surface antigen